MSIKYFYDKYYVEENRGSWGPEETRQLTGRLENVNSNDTWYSSVTWNSDRFRYEGSGGIGFKDRSIGSAGYEIHNGSTSCAAWYNRKTSNTSYDRVHVKTRKRPLLGQKKGSLLESNIIANNGTYPEDGRHSDGYWYVKKGPVNKEPTLQLFSSTNHRVLQEGDILKLEGVAKDDDVDDIITIKYSVNNPSPQNLTAGVAVVPFDKDLVYTDGKLINNGKVVARGLVDNRTHRLEIWAEDDKGGKSAVITISFNIIKNRSPILNVDIFEKTEGLIDDDIITLVGNVIDPDGDDLIVKTDNNKIIYEGKDGDFEYDIKVKDLKIGNNDITITAEDSYGAKSTQHLRIRKDGDSEILDWGVARFKIEHPHLERINEILVWIERHSDLDLKLYVGSSDNDKENYVEVDINTAPIFGDLVEDEGILQIDNKKNVYLKVEFDRNDGKFIEAIMGVLE